MVAVVVLAIVTGKVLVALPAADSPIITRQEPVGVGEVLGSGSIMVIDRPGLYGLGTPPEGSTYGVARGNLLRIDAATGAVQAVVRPWLTAVERNAP